MTELGLKHFHFLGICGTAMGAVAAALKEQGYTVTGSDEKIYPPMSTFLESKGIRLFEGFAKENIPQSAEMIVIGNAIRRGNPEVEEVLNRGLLYSSLPEVLKTIFLQGKHNLVVTGTHGKTTTTSLLTWLLLRAKLDPSYMIGGLPNNLGQGASLSKNSAYFVIEGDEYDTAFFDKRSKFFHYLPTTLIINNIEFDHADIYRDIDEIKLSFRRLVNIVPSNGTIFYNSDDPNCIEVVRNAFAKKVPVGLESGLIHSISYKDGNSSFQLGDEKFTIPMMGEFNVRNAAMAVLAAGNLGIDHAQVQDGLISFTGVRRRQEVRGIARNIKVIDDFGHHPTAIRQALKSLRQQHIHSPEQKLWALFEPRSNTTRRAVFQEQFPSAFADADGVVVAKVARMEELQPSERLDPIRLIEALTTNGKRAYYEENTSAMVERVKSSVRPGDVVVIFSNGGFDNIHTKLLEALV